MPFTSHRLLSGHPLLLIAEGDGAKSFVRLFRGCWKLIPFKARRAILAHWQNSPVSWHPKIELSDSWGDAQTCFGQVRHGGMEVRFSAKDFEVLPDAIAAWIIGHELAHVYQKVIGKRPGGDSLESNEDDADEIARSWGFDRTLRVLLGHVQASERLSVEDACKRLAELRLT
jgi:hypothetical protein